MIRPRGSEKAPPPWRAGPPQVSIMILRPVRPASPIGPPTSNRPAGKVAEWGMSLRRAAMDVAGQPGGAAGAVLQQVADHRGGVEGDPAGRPSVPALPHGGGPHDLVGRTAHDGSAGANGARQPRIGV